MISPLALAARLPPSSETLSLDHDLPFTQLQPILLGLVASLQRQFPAAALRKADAEAPGFAGDEAIDFDAVRRMCDVPPMSAEPSRQVSLTVFPDDHSFVLTLFTYQTQDGHAHGGFELSGQRSVIERVAHDLRPLPNAALFVEPVTPQTPVAGASIIAPRRGRKRHLFAGLLISGALFFTFTFAGPALAAREAKENIAYTFSPSGWGLMWQLLTGFCWMAVFGLVYLVFARVFRGVAGIICKIVLSAAFAALLVQSESDVVVAVAEPNAGQVTFLRRYPLAPLKIVADQVEMTPYNKKLDLTPYGKGAGMRRLEWLVTDEKVRLHTPWFSTSDAPNLKMLGDFRRDILDSASRKHPKEGAAGNSGRTPSTRPATTRTRTPSTSQHR